MMKIGEIYIAKIPVNTVEPYLEGYRNYYYETNVPGHANFNFRAGINKSADFTDLSGNCRCPVIVIDSNPSTAGSRLNPWRDEFYPERGVIRYYGDNKTVKKESGWIAGIPEAGNNKYLLAQATVHCSGSREERLNKAIPILFFEKCTDNGRTKALRKFQGYGVIEKVERVTQYDPEHDIYYPNYVFTFCVFSMSEDGEAFDWSWIADRCNPSLTADDIYRRAPKAWKEWVDSGNEKLYLVRRSVADSDIVRESEQQFPVGSAGYKRLNEIYQYYEGREHDFEYLALEVTRKVLEKSGAEVHPGWIVRKNGDHGNDFVLRADLGNDKLSGIQIKVLGQARYEKPSGTVSGNDIAGTVAALKRGWIGAFVTLQAFAEITQREVKEEQYPVMLINGKKVVEVVERELYESGMSLKEYLDSVKKTVVLGMGDVRIHPVS